MIRVAVRVGSVNEPQMCRSGPGSSSILPTTHYAYGGLI
jgi:hypothetical protein